MATATRTLTLTPIGIVNPAQVPGSTIQCTTVPQGTITSSLFTRTTFSVSALLTTGVVLPNPTTPTISLVTTLGPQTFPCTPTGLGQPRPNGQVAYATTCIGTITGTPNSIIPGSVFTVVFNPPTATLIAQGLVPNVLSLAPAGENADALAALPVDSGTALGSLRVGAGVSAASDLSVLATAPPGPLAESLVLVGFDAVRPLGGGPASTIGSVVGPVPLAQRLSLLGDVPIAAVVDPGLYAADRLGVLGRLESGYGRDGPTIGLLRRETTAPFRL